MKTSHRPLPIPQLLSLPLHSQTSPKSYLCLSLAPLPHSSPIFLTPQLSASCPQQSSGIFSRKSSVTPRAHTPRTHLSVFTHFSLLILTHPSSLGSTPTEVFTDLPNKVKPPPGGTHCSSSFCTIEVVTVTILRVCAITVPVSPPQGGKGYCLYSLWQPVGVCGLSGGHSQCFIN